MFQSDLDESSFVSHQYIIAGQASSSVNIPEGGPWGCCGKRGRRYRYQTAHPRTADLGVPEQSNAGRRAGCRRRLVEILHRERRRRRRALERLSGDKAHLSPARLEQERRDAADGVLSRHPRAALPAVSWITPTCANSDHAGCDSDTGPKWVASLVNAIGESPYWKSSAIFVFWDDPGGWYDHVRRSKLDYDGLGFRVPLLVISPYAKKGFVSHVSYEHGSLLRFVEDRFGLQSARGVRQRVPTRRRRIASISIRLPERSSRFQSTMSARDFERQPLDPAAGRHRVAGEGPLSRGPGTEAKAGRLRLQRRVAGKGL